MSVQTQIDRLSGNVTAALAAIAEKGVTVPDGSTSDALAELIASIEAGGGGGMEYGMFTLAEATNDYSVPHGLGVLPSFVCLVASHDLYGSTTDVGKGIGVSFASSSDFGLHQGITYRKSGSMTANVMTANDSIGSGASKGFLAGTDSSTIRFCNSKYQNFYYLMSGVTYLWFAIA